MNSLPGSPNSGPAAPVAGATGNVGGAVVDALVARGVPVRAVVRAATRPLPAGAQRVVADLDEPRSLVDGLDGVGSAFLLPGFADMPALVQTPRDCVRLLGEALGRPLRFEAVPDDVARVEMAAEMPERYVDAFFRFYVDRTIDEGETFDTVQAVTGRAPRSFEQWARVHVADFAPDTQATMPSGV